LYSLTKAHILSPLQQKHLKKIYTPNQVITDYKLLFLGSFVSLNPSLNFIVFVPPRKQTPLKIRDIDGKMCRNIRHYFDTRQEEFEILLKFKTILHEAIFAATYNSRIHIRDGKLVLTRFSSPRTKRGHLIKMNCLAL
jgi:hypothetical protein